MWAKGVFFFFFRSTQVKIKKKSLWVIRDFGPAFFQREFLSRKRKKSEIPVEKNIYLFAIGKWNISFPYLYGSLEKKTAA